MFASTGYAGRTFYVRKSRMHRILLSMGSNIGDSPGILRGSLKKLEERYVIGAVSSLYLTEPYGFAEQPPFYNLCVVLEASESAEDVLLFLQDVEKTFGRERDIANRYAPRTLDIDILLFDDAVIDSGILSVPHPRMHLRSFVLIPASEIAPDWRHPILKRSIAELRDTCEDRLKVEKI